jgi:Flp pilus assembly protein TadD
LNDATAQLEEALRLKPDYLEAYNNLALAYANSGRVDDAIRQLQIAIRLNPDSTDARRNLEMLEASGGAPR